MTSDRVLTGDPRGAWRASTILLVLAPLLALAAAIVLFVRGETTLGLSTPVPLDKLAFERAVLHPGEIELWVRNVGPQPLRVSQVIVNDAVWPFAIEPAPELRRLQRAVLRLSYPWVEGEAYAVRVLTSSAIPFDLSIPAAVETPVLSARTVWGFTRIGLYVGLVPIYLGMLWFPALGRLGRRWMPLVLAVTVGLLLALGVETLAEGIELAIGVPGPLQGLLLVAMGTIVTFVSLDTVSRRQVAAGKDESGRRLALAYTIALGIGIHNLGEGLAIGAAYSAGEVSLGAFLVVGFIVQNITEGFGIVAPLLQDRPSLRQLALMGLVGGAPAVVGAWVGAFTFSQVMAALFFGVGAGAVLEVAYEVVRMLERHVEREPLTGPITRAAGVAAGLLAMYALGLLVR